MYSGIGLLLVILVVYELIIVSLPSSAASHVCHKYFDCGYFRNLSFPFTDSSQPDCGLFVANCSSDPTISLDHKTNQRNYELLNIFNFNSIRVLDTKRQDDLIQRRCNSFHVIHQGSLEAISFTVEPNITMIKCDNDKNETEPLKSLIKYTSCNVLFTIYYRNPKDDDNKPPLDDIGPLPQDCQTFTLPMASVANITNKTGVFGLLTAEFDLHWQLSDNCSDCLNGKKGSQCDGDNGYCAIAGKLSKAYCLTFYRPADLNGSYRPLTHSHSIGLSGGAIAGIIIGVLAVLVSICVCVVVYGKRKRKIQKVSPFALTSESLALHASAGPGAFSDKAADSATVGDGVSPGVTGINVNRSREFSYEELAGATDDFNISYKIGQGGFGAVYYAELRGEKAAIKKMDMQATREFLAELKVLTHVHHLNLVRLIGYCVEGFLFLVYEYIENGNLSQHLRGTEREPLSWSTRVQIALDSARGLEYIHEHTVHVYIHRDIKSANILIDGNYRGKIADFGLTKLTKVGSSSWPTRLAGTFGYMPPEYAQYCVVSPKVDVYAFGVVLYELISAKEAVVKVNSVTEFKGLVGLFEEVLSLPDSSEDLRKVIDPRLEGNYPLDSVRKMAQLAKACTRKNPKLRPSMRSIVVALMTLSSSTEDWDVGPFYGN